MKYLKKYQTIIIVAALLFVGYHYLKTVKAVVTDDIGDGTGDDNNGHIQHDLPPRDQNQTNTPPPRNPAPFNPFINLKMKKADTSNKKMESFEGFASKKKAVDFNSYR